MCLSHLSAQSKRDVCDGVIDQTRCLDNCHKFSKCGIWYCMHNNDVIYCRTHEIGQKLSHPHTSPFLFGILVIDTRSCEMPYLFECNSFIFYLFACSAVFHHLLDRPISVSFRLIKGLNLSNNVRLSLQIEIGSNLLLPLMGMFMYYAIALLRLDYIVFNINDIPTVCPKKFTFTRHQRIMHNHFL